MKLIVASNDRTVGVQGYAGTGKTTMLRRARGLLEKKGYEVRGLAPSASAARTVHAFQGRTVDIVIAAMEANHPHLTTQKSFYVEISRARDHAELVTDDKAALKEQLEGATGKRIAALEVVEPERAKGHDAGPGAGPRAEGRGPRARAVTRTGRTGCGWRADATAVAARSDTKGARER